jgi:hypothetical protein
MVQHPLVLVSAYDIGCADPPDRREILAVLETFNRAGGAILLDSGNYESYWKADRGWSPGGFATVLAYGLHHLAFTHDVQDQLNDYEHIADEVEQAVMRDQAHSPSATVAPIVHGTSDALPAAVQRVVERLHPVMVAVPERELGEGLLARAETVARIRAAIDQTVAVCPLHILGTGNPLSLLVFVRAGADSFDGLEWCQTTIDAATARPYHFQQRELFGHQDPFASADLPYTEATLAHNLLFYRRFLEQLRDSILAGELDSLLARYLPDLFVHELSRRLKDR